MVSEIATKYAMYLLNRTDSQPRGPTESQVAQAIDVAAREIARPLVEAVLSAAEHKELVWCLVCNKRFGHNTDCIIGNLAIEARKLKGD